MTAAVTVQSSEARVLVVGVNSASAAIKLPEGRVIAAANIPAVSINAIEARVLPVVSDPAVIEVEQARVLAVVHGHVADPTVRAWTFTLDGHDFYVLQLGETETIVYDTQAEQWYNWGSDSLKYWRPLTGCNWIGGTGVGAAYGSNIVVGDYSVGTLYFLDPDGDTDDDPTFGDTIPHPFERIAQGQMVIKGYDKQRCYGVALLGSIGDLTVDTLTGVKLEFSDDKGNTYVDAGTIDVSNGDYEGRVFWRSLGSMQAPGRLFRITDSGALRRIDSLDMYDGEDMQ